MFAETRPELIAAFVGHLKSGVIHVPINTRYKADEARHILEDSGAVAVLVGDEGRDVADGELGEIVVKSDGMMSVYWGRAAACGASGLPRPSSSPKAARAFTPG